MGSYVQVAGNFCESRELMLLLQGKRARGRKRNADFAKNPAYLGACEQETIFAKSVPCPAPDV